MASKRLKHLSFFLVLICLLVIYFVFLSSFQTTQFRAFSRKFIPLPQKEKKIFKIVLWTPFFGVKDYIPPSWMDSCDYKNCLFTPNNKYYNQSDAVIFHLRDSEIRNIPHYRPSYKQRWILLHHESPEHTPEYLLKAFHGLINWTATYRRESDILLSPRLIKTNYPLDLADISINRPGKVSWLVSNCETPSKREIYVDILSRSIQVDTYGKCGRKQCLPKMSADCYDRLSSNYYFYLSFENSICPDYLTEKFFTILNYPIIPVVFGGADYDQFAPPNSYINALHFDHPRKLAHYLDHLIEHPQEYKKYFEWKKNYKIQETHYACLICRLLNKPNQDHNVWNDLSWWWFKEAPCKSWRPPTAYE